MQHNNSSLTDVCGVYSSETLIAERTIEAMPDAAESCTGMHLDGSTASTTGEATPDATQQLLVGGTGWTEESICFTACQSKRGCA